MEGQKDDNGKLPIGRVLEQFPRALEAIAKCSQYGNSKYELDIDWQNFRRVKDAYNRYNNAEVRHTLEHNKGHIFDLESKIPHIFHALWNNMAKIECMLEAVEQESKRIQSGLDYLKDLKNTGINKTEKDE